MLSVMYCHALKSQKLKSVFLHTTVLYLLQLQLQSTAQQVCDRQGAKLFVLLLMLSLLMAWCIELSLLAKL